MACSEFANFSSGLRVSLSWRFLLKRCGSSRALQFWRAFPTSGDCTLLHLPIPREVLLHHRLSAPFARLCWHSHRSGLGLLGVLRPLLYSATFQMMVRQDRGFDPNLVDLFSCRLFRNDRDEFSVSFQNTRSFFEIFTHWDRKFCNSIGSLVLANTVAAISIHGRAKLDAVVSMMAKTFSFVHELTILIRISDSVELCICFAAYSSLWRLYIAV